ncbi:alpha-1,4-glucan:maltose-1-phosphate maltosyltransferase [Pseudorhodoferax soli]|uniref:Alpha-1,4-glucan:maltose-1-phosphate maltosyltransferase n=2 Tax=Pseudorhodoferax soli TaxID=545864 RepID=A0A368XLP8_9BURK|nr:alpha-1,4-glucan--maltose-1-phosphate maltosyltransferase [Pseudorhodoferax soli]RCW68893.1 alpha-1,4-glucan:maltose-1-phosphate maltosyltransferase [Pseudorhodoferax soli]
MPTEAQADKKPRRPRAKPAAAVPATDLPAAAAATPAPAAPAGPVVDLPDEGQARAVIDAVLPQVDAGRFAVKRVVGEALAVTAHAFTDGHDKVRVRLCLRKEGADAWQETEMQAVGNDVWSAACTPDAQGRWRYTVCAWVDHFQSWRAELLRRLDLADILIAARVGAELVRQASERAEGDDRARLARLAENLRSRAEQAGRATIAEMDSVSQEVASIKAAALSEDLAALADLYPDRSHAVWWSPEGLPLVVDRERAAFSSWYEMFPRSAALEEGRHGTFKDVQARLPYVAEMGFDVLYLPPIHPIGRARRKGRNNTLVAQEGDVGSPWAIGAEEGGHKDVLPALGTPEDFRELVRAANALGIELALDIAFQCAPDHPYVKAHPDWFRKRPDGSVQYAENPPKKYQDIYPFDFETPDWRAMWLELKSVFDHWIGEGVRIFRVDNPHTKAFAFWEWVITAVKAEHPDVLFLAEAFTRPKVMHRLAKLGFSQSYTYFTWRNDRHELMEYFTELAHGPGADYYRPNAWPNTPDILNEHLHHGPRAIFMSRLVLAATLSASYGIYGPPYELLQGEPVKPGSEEYMDSEKYQVRHWGELTLDRPDSIAGFIATVNRIRKENAALHSNASLRFFDTSNPYLIAYAKRDADGRNAVLTVVNIDATFTQSGWVHVDAAWLGADGGSFVAEDLLTGQSFQWQDGGNFVMLVPSQMPAHVIKIRGNA